LRFGRKHNWHTHECCLQVFRHSSLNKATDAADGSVDETNNYYLYGETRSHSGTTDSPHKFAGQPLDPESSLYYYGARYCDPVIGRFISADSIAPSFTSHKRL